jgi:hypothetical protein
MTHPVPSSRLARGALILAALLLVSCGAKISAENFERIQDGMTQKEVIAILGEPAETSSVNIAGVSGGMATWKDGNTAISVQFLNGKVQAKQLAKEARPQAK